MTTELDPPQLVRIGTHLWTHPGYVIAILADGDTCLVWVDGTGEGAFRTDRSAADVADLVSAALSVPAAPSDLGGMDP